jgi:hypothetical protein
VASIGEEHDGQDWTVRGLRLPDPLIALLTANLWRDPQDSALRALMPWFEDPLIFLSSLDQIQRESGSLDEFADDDASAQLFRELRGSRVAHAVELPWLDVEKAVLIAVNRNPGDDVAIALDYRTNPLDPRVVASDFWTNPQQCARRVVAPTFTKFVKRLQLGSASPR